MSENKFIKRLKGEQTAKSVLEIKNESAKTSFANMPQGTSNAIDVFSDHRGNATAVLNGTTNWKVSNSELLLVDAVSGDGQDFTSTYSVFGSGLWVNASYTFPSTGDPRHPVAMVFNPSTKWVLKVCGDNLIVDGGSTVDFTMLVKIGTASVYSKNFTIRESAGQFSKEFIIDFGEANSDVVKAGGLSTLTVQLLCGTANASARIYNGMTVLTCLQRKVDASAVSNSSANVEDVLDGNIIPSDYFSNPEFIDDVEDGEDAYAVFTRDGDDINLSSWTPKDEIARKEEIIVKSDTIPTATADLVGSVYQYVGTTDSSYTHGYIYECVSDGQEPATYTWERIDVQPGTEVIDNLTSTSSTSALSANQGRILNDRIDDVSGRGRFLALWNCATGLAESNPTTSPYQYKAGDYFVVGTISSATPAVNYKPDGSSYTTGVASTTVETNEVSVNDTYFYDGTIWKLQSNAQKEVSFSALAGSPYDNANLATALDSKVDKTSTANRIYGTNASGTQTTWQAGDNIELAADGKINVIGVQQQMFEMPEATADLLGSIVQYLGEDTIRYTHGVMYQCVPVYGSFTVTAVGLNNVTLDEETFKESFLYDASISSYTFECTRGGLRQTWRLPNGRSWMGGLMDFGIGFMGRPSVGATITLTRSVVGYAWEAYAGVSAGNDKIKIVGEKISGINVVGQYNQTTMPAARAELAGKIIQFNGESDLLSIYRDGHFYRCEENRNMRNYTLEADPMKYSTLVVDNWLTLEDFMYSHDDPVTFMWQGVGRGWVEEESMSMLGTEDLTQYGITYTLESGQTLEAGDKITINFTMSYFWRHITVQDGVEVSNYLPEASSQYVDRVLLLNNVLNGSLPEPESLGVDGKLYTCIEKYNEMTGDLEYEWKPLPYQFNLLQYTELPSDITKVYTGQCIQYVGTSRLWNKYAEDVYLEKGHIYRATITDEDDPDFAAVRYVDAHPYQMVVMPGPIAAYAGVITQYVGENGDYTNGHFYKCVPTGQMTGPSDKYKKPEDAEWSVSIDPSVLATHTTDPDQAQVFEFRSQAEGADWVLKVNNTTWQTVSIADYGITITGSVPYGSTLKVKYVEPQPEYEWQEITVQQGGGLVDDVLVHGQSVVVNRVADLSVVEQVSTMATASLGLVGRIVQYTGNTTNNLVHAYFYEAITTLQHRTTTNYGIRIYDQTRFADFLKQDVESEGLDVSYFTVNRDSQSNLIQVRCYSTGGAFSTVHSYTDATFATTGLTADETVGGAIATFSTAYDWTQVDVQPSGASGDIDCGTM